MTPRHPATVAVLGSINMDSVVGVRRFPRPGETVMALTTVRHPGGKGANQAIAAARAGAAVDLIGAVGDDEEGRVILAMLKREGVDCGAVRICDAPTGAAQIVVDQDGENQIVVATGANALAGEAPTGLDARVFLAQLESPLDAVSCFLAGRPASSIALLNAAPYRPDAGSCLAQADVVIVNETELVAYGDASSLPQSPLQIGELGRTLLTRAGQRIIVTLGGAGSLTIAQDTMTVSPAIPAYVVDSTGAGDCFCGYLAAGLATEHALDRSLIIAHHAAALSVSRPGAASAIPLMAEVRASMRS